MVNTGEIIDMPEEFKDRYEKKESSLHGIGLFSMKSFSEGDILFPARIGEFRTDGGRFINHSPHYNVKFVKLDNNDLMVVSTRCINSGEEFLIDYRQASRVNLGRIIS